MSGKIDRIERLFQKLERKKKKLMNILREVDHDTYNKQPSPAKWSVGQIANHIYLSEKLSLAYLKKKLSYPESVPRFSIRSWGATLFLKIVLRTSYKAKSPKAINMWDQQPILEVAELDQKWKAVRQEIIDFINLNQASYGSHLAYRHPFVGRMTMHQMLIFFNDHMAHHLKQINRTLKRVK